MNRLTKRNEKGIAYLAIADSLSKRDQELEGSKPILEGLYAMFQKLAEYEDLEEQGLLIKLPCKVDDTVYQIMYDRTIENYKVVGFELDERGKLYVRILIERPAATLKLSYRKEDLYFLREEAEKALGGRTWQPLPPAYKEVENE